ncbi:MAG TPA: efflux RND transporter periplasmic adaptor subunit [Hyphomicrobiaceae bacterium]|nr:efflux RND transporter periplasmic adaptor subunit [Hyphomicrobiaceae bacterium]
MPRGDSSLNMLIVAAILALGVGYYVPQTFSAKPAREKSAEPVKAETAGAANVANKSGWAASAAGRVEPMGGEVKVGAQAPGRIAEVLVALNDKVVAGDLLARLDDEELVARVNAAVAEVGARKRERDNGEMSTGKVAQDRRSAEDTVASSERQLVQAREDFDRAYRARRAGQSGPDADVEKAREAIAKARERLENARSTLRKALAVDGLPPPSRPEVALTAARAELTAADAALERTRIRAPSAGTALQVSVKVGEIVAPSPENVLVVIGDLSALRVRAEIEERDIGKLRVGQGAVIRSDAFPNKDFEGKVASLGQALGPSRIGQRGPRKPTDVDMLEILIDLAGQPPLLPGMRVDVYLKPDTTAQAK